MLTREQIDHCEAFGLLVLRAHLPKDLIDELRGTDDFQTDVNQSVQPWLERHPSMSVFIRFQSRS